MQNKVVGRGVRLHGGDGCSTELPIARAFLDSPASTTHGGTTGIQEEIIGRSLGV